MDAKEGKALAILDAHFTIFEGRIHEHISSMFKWLVATLFVANGGALLFLAKERSADEMSCSVWFFGIGLICSLLVGITSSLVALFTGRDLAKLRSQIQVATLNEEIDDDLRLKLSTPKKASIWIWTPAAIGILSFVLFSTGLILLLSS